MSNDWLNREFEKAAKEASTFPRWMQNAIQTESMKSGQAVQDSRPPEANANGPANDSVKNGGEGEPRT